MKKLPSRMVVSVKLDLERCAKRREAQGSQPTYPNVTPEPNMYCPKVLTGPLGPAPYLMMLKPPLICVSTCSIARHSDEERCTIDEAHD